MCNAHQDLKDAHCAAGGDPAVQCTTPAQAAACEAWWAQFYGPSGSVRTDGKRATLTYQW